MTHHVGTPWLWAGVALLLAALLAAALTLIVRRRLARAGTTSASFAWNVTRKVGVAVVGGLVLAAGVAMIALPGPAFVVIPIGLTILASEFQWAHRLLAKVRARFLSPRRPEKPLP